MTIEEIKNISAEECEARKSQIAEEMNAEGADLEALTAEVDALNERKKALIAEEEQRKALANEISTDKTATIIEERKEGRLLHYLPL